MLMTVDGGSRPGALCHIPFYDENTLFLKDIKLQC